MLFSMLGGVFARASAPFLKTIEGKRKKMYVYLLI